jgi:gluconokinase
VPTIVVMGVTGVGKTTIGRLLADALRLPFLDGDDFHTDDAKARMHEGIPLTDADREPWLDRLNRMLHEHERSGVVLACSALTDSYRRRLTSGLSGVQFVLLTGEPELIYQRVVTRHGHYAGATLLPSQLAMLEPPPDAITIDIDDDPGTIAQEALDALAASPDGGTP